MTPNSARVRLNRLGERSVIRSTVSLEEGDLSSARAEGWSNRSNLAIMNNLYWEAVGRAYGVAASGWTEISKPNQKSFAEGVEVRVKPRILIVFRSPSLLKHGQFPPVTINLAGRTVFAT